MDKLIISILLVLVLVIVLYMGKTQNLSGNVDTVSSKVSEVSEVSEVSKETFAESPVRTFTFQREGVERHEE